MATMILLPDSDVSNHPNWVAVGATDNWDCLKDDNGGTSYVKASVDTATMVIGFADPDDVTPVNDGVAEASIASIDSIRFLSSGKSTHRFNPSLVDIAYETPSITAESCSYNAHRSAYETINGTAQAYSDGNGGSTDWTYTDLERLQMICTKDSTVQVYLSYLVLEVTYTAAIATVTDNATFFGANF